MSSDHRVLSALEMCQKVADVSRRIRRGLGFELAHEAAIERCVPNAYNFIMMHAVPSRKISRPFSLLCLFAVSVSASAVCTGSAKARTEIHAAARDMQNFVTVIKATNGKPVENAAVIFHPMKNGKDEGNLELKTNEEGKAIIEVIPIGDTVRLQVDRQRVSDLRRRLRDHDRHQRNHGENEAP